MTTLAVVIPLLALAIVGAWFAVHLIRMIKLDGYGFRAGSGLPRDWSPTPDLPSTPYTAKPHF
jgi:hypothetical protein